MYEKSRYKNILNLYLKNYLLQEFYGDFIVLEPHLYIIPVI